MRSLQIRLYKSDILWFNVYHPSQGDVIHSDYDERQPMVTFSHNFDYETLSAVKKRFFLDIGMKFLPVGEIMFRSQFEFRFKGGWKELMSPEFLDPMVRVGLDKCIQAFREKCLKTSHALSSSFSLPEAFIGDICNHMMDSYSNYRMSEDTSNQVMDTTQGLQFRSGKSILLIVSFTFMVIDAVLYNTDAFDRKHNQEQFGQLMPDVSYHSLKIKCMGLMEHKISLSLKQTVRFIQCLDFTLQMMMGDHEEKIMELLAPQGADKEVQDNFIAEGSNLLEYTTQSFKDSHAHLVDLDKKYDWNSLIR